MNNHEGRCECNGCSFRRYTQDKEVERLEEKLLKLQRARLGRWIVSWWFWCAKCGADKVMGVEETPDNARDNRPKASTTTAICPSCTEVERRKTSAHAVTLELPVCSTYSAAGDKS
jgi:hypothetical protein